MNPVRRKNEFQRAVRFDDHFDIVESKGFIKVVLHAVNGWEVYSVMRKMDFDKLLEDNRQDGKARFLNELINKDIEDIR